MNRNADGLCWPKMPVITASIDSHCLFVLMRNYWLINSLANASLVSSLSQKDKHCIIIFNNIQAVSNELPAEIYPLVLIIHFLCYDTRTVAQECFVKHTLPSQTLGLCLYRKLVECCVWLGSNKLVCSWAAVKYKCHLSLPTTTCVREVLQQDWFFFCQCTVIPIFTIAMNLLILDSIWFLPTL